MFPWLFCHVNIDTVDIAGLQSEIRCEGLRSCDLRRVVIYGQGQVCPGRNRKVEIAMSDHPCRQCPVTCRGEVLEIRINITTLPCFCAAICEHELVWIGPSKCVERLVLFSAMGHPFQQFTEMMSSSSVTSGSSRVCRSTDLCLPAYGLT